MTVAVLITALALAAAEPPVQDSPPAAPPAKSSAPAAEVSGVTVTGTRPAVETSIDRRSYAVANDLQAQTGSIADVLRNVPSVQVDLQGNVSLRGSSVMVMVDGKPSSLFSGESLALALQSLPASQVDRIEVITNPSAEFRADGAGGIINLITKKAKGAGWTGSLRVQGSTGDRALVSANVGYNSSRLSTTADFSYRQDHRLPVTDSRQSLLNPATGLPDHNQDVSMGQLTQQIVQGHVGADYDLDAKTRLSGSLLIFYSHAASSSIDQFEQDGDSGDPTTAFSRFSDQPATQYNGQASLILRHTWAEGNDLTLSATYNGNQYAADRVDDVIFALPVTPARSDEIYRANFNHRSAFTADYERPLLGMAKLKLGYDIEYADSFIEHHGGFGAPGAAITPDPSQSDNFVDDETHNQAYVTYEQPFGKLDALFGLRGEIVHLALDQRTQGVRSSQDYNRLYPTLHLAYDLTDGRRLTASYSKRVLRPSPSQLDPFTYSQSPTVLQQGNPDLAPQDTDSYEFGYEARKDASSLIATLYYRQTNNGFSTVFIDRPNGVLLEQTENVGARTNAGLELELANKLTPKLSYNFNADGYWTELSAPNLGFTQTQSAFTGFGSANLNWQVTPKDYVQFNLFVNGKSLFPQGYQPPVVSGNIGYRHTINDKVSWTIVVQDPFKTMKGRLVLDSFGGTDRQVFSNNNRMVSLTLVWTFAGKPKPANFDFAPGGAAAP